MTRLAAIAATPAGVRYALEPARASRFFLLLAQDFDPARGCRLDVGRLENHGVIREKYFCCIFFTENLSHCRVIHVAE